MSLQLGSLGSALLDGAVGLLTAFIAVSLFMPRFISYMRRSSKVGIDVHKLNRPEVAELGGIGIILGVLAGLAVTAFLARFILFSDIQTTFTLSQGVNLILYRDATLARIVELGAVVAVVGLVGLYDDFYPLKGRQKPLLTMGLTLLALSPIMILYYLNRAYSAGDPLVLSFFFTPYIEIPGRDPVSLTILFPLIALFAVTIGANAMNMMDVYNGIMPATTILVAVALAVSALILERHEAFYLLLPFLGALLAYYRFNRLPAKVFSGDVGSLAVGAGLVMIAFLARLEIILLVAFIPFIINGLDTLLSVGFRERRDMDARPTLLTAEGKIALNPDPRAPLPLANLFLLDGPKTEHELIRSFTYTVGFSSLLGILTALIMLVLKG